MKNNTSHPILAKEGWPIIAVAFVLAFLVWWLIGGFIAFIFGILFIFVLQFFRDPKRAVSQTPNSVLAGADGRICKIQNTVNPYTGEEAVLISTFMNVFNVHSNYCPIGGTVEAIHYIPGRFVNADLDKASELNERNAIVCKTEEGPRITWVQIAGLVARRIVCHLHVGEEVSRGQRFGFIRFGSRVDVYVPPESEVLVFVGQKVRATDTVLALLREPAKESRADAEEKSSAAAPEAEQQKENGAS